MINLNFSAVLLRRTNWCCIITLIVWPSHHVYKKALSSHSFYIIHQRVLYVLKCTVDPPMHADWQRELRFRASQVGIQGQSYLLLVAHLVISLKHIEYHGLTLCPYSNGRSDKGLKKIERLITAKHLRSIVRCAGCETSRVAGGSGSWPYWLGLGAPWYYNYQIYTRKELIFQSV